MESTTCSKIREQNFLAVHGILAAIKPPNHVRAHFVDPQIFSRLPIRLSQMPFYPDSQVDFGLRFSKPFPEQQFDEAFAERFGVEPALLSWSSPKDSIVDARACAYALKTNLSSVPIFEDSPWSIDREYGKSLMKDSKWNFTTQRFTKSRWANLGEGGGRGPGSDVYWDTIGIFQACEVDPPEPGESCSTRAPHMSCILAHDAPLDDRVLRSELVCITTIMKERLRYPEWHAHRFFPVFVYTLNGSHVRITQAHFDGQFLQLRRTEPVEISHGETDLASMKMLMRWLMAEPLGDTKWEGEVEEDVETSHAIPPSTPKRRAMRV